jgi:hypothetical protein
MTAREAARRYSAIVERAAAGFATALLHHWMGHDRSGRPRAVIFWLHSTSSLGLRIGRHWLDEPATSSIPTRWRVAQNP